MCSDCKDDTMWAMWACRVTLPVVGFHSQDVDQGVVSVLHHEYCDKYTIIISQVQEEITSLVSVGYQGPTAIHTTELDKAKALSLSWVQEPRCQCHRESESALCTWDRSLMMTPVIR